MAVSNQTAWREFVTTFDGIARHHHRYEVFRDFVTVSAISLHNAIRKEERLEQEYLGIVGRYPKDDVTGFCKLFAKLVILLDAEPRDILGTLYMSLDLGSNHVGQFFTPPEVSEMMARMVFGDILQQLSSAPFITVGEPACGAGGMVLAIVKVMLSHGHDPARRMWVQCQDVDRLAALMCYVQLSLWNVPAAVIVGNTLMAETREVFHTPQHYLGLWDAKLRRHWDERETGEAQATQEPETSQSAAAGTVVKTTPLPPLPDQTAEKPTKKPASPPGGAVQLDFGF